MFINIKSSLFFVFSLGISFSGIGQEPFTTKAYKIFAAPIYSFNDAGLMRTNTFLATYNPNGSLLKREMLSAAESQYDPALVRISKPINIGLGLEYEFYLKNRWYMGISAEWRTNHFLLEYQYNIGSLLGEVPWDTRKEVYEYNYKLKTFTPGISIGKQIGGKNQSRAIDIKLGLGVVFIASRAKKGKEEDVLYGLQTSNNTISYVLGVKALGNFTNKEGFFYTSHFRSSLYIGTEAKKHLFKHSRLRAYYGIQGDYDFFQLGGSNKNTQFVSSFDYKFDGDNLVSGKYKRVHYSIRNIPSISFRLGLRF